MRPRNEREREVVRLYNSLPQLTNSQRLWIEKEVVGTRIYTSGHRCWCSKCGGEWKVGKAGEREVCPHCGTESKVEASRKTVIDDFGYAQFLQVYKGWQVIRTVLVRWNCKRGAGQRVREMPVWQRWCQPGKPVVLLGTALTCYPDYCRIPYSLWENPLVIKDNANSYYYQDNIVNAKVYPRMSLLKVYSKNIGKRPDFSVYSPSVLLGDIFSCPYLESLYKANKRAKLGEMLRHTDMLNKYWQSVKVALRHGYEPESWWSYWEHLRALRYLHYDMRSPRYVAPKDFGELHDLVTRQYRNKVDAMTERMEEARRLRLALQQEEWAKKQEEEAKAFAESFAKRIARFAELQFGNKDLVISPLMSIEAFRDEGRAMHHCVFSMGYYKKPQSLILSARTRAENERMETIEVSLTEFKILQSMGIYDRPSAKHNEICSLVNRAMPRIKRMATAV